jgi:hypothetical protein
MFVPGKAFLQPSLMFAGKAETYPTFEALNSMVGSWHWKGWPGTNTLAYYKNL